MDEAGIILKCQRGDLEKFSLLYDKYIKKIYDFIYYKTHHKETAEDITSRVFIKAIEKISSFNIAKGTFQAWIYQVARNTVIDHYRTAKMDDNIEDVWDLSDDYDIKKDIDTKEKVRELRKHLKELTPAQREIVIMRTWQELSYKEISEILSKSEASCKMAYSRALKNLKDRAPLSVMVYLACYL